MAAAGFWDKPQAIEFAFRQIAAANRTATRLREQENLEETQLEAIAELTRFYKGDCAVAASLAGLAAFPFVLWRLHDRYLFDFPACPDIVPPLARRLAGAYRPASPPAGGRPEPAEFPIPVPRLFQAIAPHLARYPDLRDLLARSALANAGAFTSAHLAPLAAALPEDSGTQELLRSLCGHLPTAAADHRRNAEILRFYMLHCHARETDTALLRRLAAQGAGDLSREAMHWLARQYHGHAGVADFLVDRMREATEPAARFCAFHCLLLHFSGHPPIADLVLAQPARERDPAIAASMRQELTGRSATSQLWYDDAEKIACATERTLLAQRAGALEQLQYR